MKRENFERAIEIQNKIRRFRSRLSMFEAEFGSRFYPFDDDHCNALAKEITERALTEMTAAVESRIQALEKEFEEL